MLAAHPDFLKPFLAAQTAIKGALKDSQNSHLKNKYACLESVIEAVKPALAANGFIFTQGVSDDCTRMETTLFHISGHGWTSSVPLIIAKNDMQAVGSAITYARRYGLAAACGVPQIDDDAESTMERPQKPATTATVATPAKPEPYRHIKHRDLCVAEAGKLGISSNALLLHKEKLVSFLESNASTADLSQWIDVFFKKTDGGCARV